MKDEILSFHLGIIHLARTQNFPKKNIYYHLIRTDTRAYEMERNFNFSENFAYVLNEWSLGSNEDHWVLFEKVYRWLTNSLVYVYMESELSLTFNISIPFFCKTRKLSKWYRGLAVPLSSHKNNSRQASSQLPLYQQKMLRSFN